MDAALKPPSELSRIFQKPSDTKKNDRTTHYSYFEDKKHYAQPATSAFKNISKLDSQSETNIEAPPELKIFENDELALDIKFAEYCASYLGSNWPRISNHR